MKNYINKFFAILIVAQVLVSQTGVLTVYAQSYDDFDDTYFDNNSGYGNYDNYDYGNGGYSNYNPYSSVGYDDFDDTYFNNSGTYYGNYDCYGCSSGGNTTGYSDYSPYNSVGYDDFDDTYFNNSGTYYGNYDCSGCGGTNSYGNNGGYGDDDYGNYGGYGDDTNYADYTSGGYAPNNYTYGYTTGYTTPSYTATFNSYTPTYTQPTYTNSYVTPTYTQTYTPTYTPTVTTCPQDAQMCSNGSIVYRTGPSCTFAACPITTPTCAFGQFLQNGVCYQYCPNGPSVPASQTCTTPATPVQCPSGQFYQNGACYKSCPNGTTIPGNQTCPTIGTPPGPICPSGQFMQNGVCYKTCQNGNTIPATQTCQIYCPATNNYVSEGMSCPNIQCANGQVYVNGACRVVCNDGSYAPTGGSCPLPTCTEYAYSGGGVTNAPCRCPSGTTITVNGQSCNPIQRCNDGSLPQNGVCYKTCPITGNRVNEILPCELPQCPTGQFYQNGGCYQTCSNGQTIPGTQSCPKCPSDQFMQNGVCYKTCPNGITVPATNTCVQACQLDLRQCSDGTSVGRSGPNCEFVCPTPPQTCPDGSTPVYGVCYKTCPNGSRVPTTQSCPNTTKTCSDGRVVNISDTCFIQCGNNVQVPEGQTCPRICSDGTQAFNGVCYKRCTDGTQVLETQSCPNPNRICSDGSVVPVNQPCPSRICSDGTTVPIGGTCYKTCSNGTRVVEGSVCYRSCPNGASVPETNLCPTQYQTCWDGSVISVSSQCPSQFKTCPNGTSVPFNQPCTRICPNGNVVNEGGICYRVCPNGASIPENQSCPVVASLPWVDLRIDKTTVAFGGSALLTWTSQNASTCVASNAWGGPKALSGTETRTNITQASTYTITCTNALGQSAVDSVSVLTGAPDIKVNTVITSIPTEITDTSARCNGIGLISNGAQSNAWFEYGTTQNLGSQTATAYIGTAITSPFSNALVNLKPNTRYYCRAVMANSNGTVKGDIVSFTTKSKKVVYVKPTTTVTKTTTVIKKPTTTTVTCSDGSSYTVTSTTTAQLLTDGAKLVVMQIEKLDGDLAPGAQVTYRLTYKNVSPTTLRDVLFKISIPQELALLTASAGAFDKETHTLSVPMLSLDPNKEGTITWTARVAKDAQIGKAVVTTGYVVYTVPGTGDGAQLQDEATAYVVGSIMPGNGDSSDTGAKKVVGKDTGRSFLPDTLIEWFALFAIILILMILGRSVYMSWKGDKATDTH